jgi:hypothetical protein
MANNSKISRTRTCSTIYNKNKRNEKEWEARDNDF